MPCRSNSATAANLTETSQLLKRYYSTKVFAQSPAHSQFLLLFYGTIRRRRSYGFTCPPRHGSETRRAVTGPITNFAPGFEPGASGCATEYANHYYRGSCNISHHSVYTNLIIST
ncbi:unnamed protein product, partial [Brenthis ino]